MDSVAGFQSLLHVWSTKKYLQSQFVSHPGLHIYSDKNTSGLPSDNDICTHAKRKYVTERGVPWNLGNKKYREALAELEELLEKHSIVSISWKNTQTFQIILSNAIIVSINISCDSPDIERIFIDRSLVKKLPDTVSDAIIDDNFLILSFSEKSQIALVYFAAGKSSNLHEWKDGDRLSTLDPKYSIIELTNDNGKRVKRNCLCNKDMNLVCLWWKSPSRDNLDHGHTSRNKHSNSNVEQCNVIWLSLTGISCVYTMDIITEMRTGATLLDAVFSHSYPNQLLTIEQSQSSSMKYLIDVCTYELVGKKTAKVYSTTIATKSDVICQARNYIQDKLVLVCRNSTIVLWDEFKRVPHITKSQFLPCHVTWHPNDVIFLLSNQIGDIQVYDIALNCLSLHLLSDTVNTHNSYLKLFPYFCSQPDLKLVSWSLDSGMGPAPETIGCCEDILLVFDRGPLCMLRLELGICTRGIIGPIELLCEYMKSNQLSEAVALLNALNWNNSSNTCFKCLILLSDHLFKLPYSLSHEECLENTLGSFYSPKQPLFEDVLIQYRDGISRIARRFFHYLLRKKRFKKAYLLAVDIGSKDLFMDIHYLALNVGDVELADASRRRAFNIHLKGSNAVLINDETDPVFNEQFKVVDSSFERISLNSVPQNPDPMLPSQSFSHGPEGFYSDMYEEATGFSSGVSEDDSGVVRQKVAKQNAFVVDL